MALEQQTISESQLLYEVGIKDWQSYLSANKLKEVSAVVLDASSKCDYGECPACYYMDDEGKRCPNKDLDLETVETWKKIFTKTETVPQQVWLPGGEPTLNSHLIEIVNSLKKIIPEVTLVSNGFKLANRDFVKELLSESELTEIDITINSVNQDVHNLMMASRENSEWQKIPNLPFDELLKNYFLGKTSMNNFAKAYQALINIAQVSDELKRELIVGINLNMNQSADLLPLVDKLEKDGGRLDFAILQSIQPTTRFTNREKDNRSFAWQRPTIKMIGDYVDQAKQLLKQGRIRDVTIIDPLPESIVKQLNLENESIYQPSDTPAIGVDGKLRTNVLT